MAVALVGIPRPAGSLLVIVAMGGGDPGGIAIRSFVHLCGSVLSVSKV
jgi:hypothetical protein